MRGIPLGLLVALVIAPAASAQELAGYDGSIPFDCQLQDVGFGTDYPDPDADPFCVEFDKRRQNVTELGIVDFLSQEPARVAAAGPKCFYYQTDHWTSSVVQGQAESELYNWDGAYFFDKARGTGGVYVENFSFNNQTSDPRMVPGFPEEYKPYFGVGRGGVQFADSGVEADPNCAALAKEKNVYAKKGGAGPAAGGAVGCLTGQGSVRRGLPGARLAARRARVIGALGQPTTRRRRVLSWCTVGDGRLIARFRRGRLAAALSTSPAYDLRGIAAGDPAADARAKLRGERTLKRRGRTRLLAVRGRRSIRLVRLRAGRVRWVGTARRKLSTRALIRLLR